MNESLPFQRMLIHWPVNADSWGIETAFIDTRSEYKETGKDVRKSLPKMQVSARGHAAA